MIKLDDALIRERQNEAVAQRDANWKQQVEAELRIDNANMSIKVARWLKKNKRTSITISLSTPSTRIHVHANYRYRVSLTDWWDYLFSKDLHVAIRSAGVRNERVTDLKLKHHLLTQMLAEHEVRDG